MGLTASFFGMLIEQSSDSGRFIDLGVGGNVLKTIRLHALIIYSVVQGRILVRSHEEPGEARNSDCSSEVT